MDNPALASINARDESKGAVVHSFDPNSSTEQKAAAAGKAKDALTPITKPKEARAVGIDVPKGPMPVPTITISDSDKASEPVLKAIDVKPGAASTASPNTPATPSSPIAPATPGTLSDQPAGAIPDWYKVGWRAATGIDDPVPTAEELDRNALHQWLGDMYYGQWFHNSGIIIFAVLSTHLFTVLRMGWGWMFLILAICATYYSTSIARFRRNARDDIQKELTKHRLASEEESADWMNSFLDRFWLIYEPVLSSTIVSSVDQILSSSTPSFLDSLKLTQFTLGTTAPRINSVRTFPRTPNDVVLMEWAFQFSPTDLSDITHAQAKLRVNPKICLEIKVGKGPASVPFPILLEDMSFKGRMRIKLKLMSAFPHVQMLEMSFMEPPVFDYVLKPLGGDTFGWDINNIPGLEPFARDMVHSILGPMMYDPNVFALNLEQLLSGTPIDAAIGVLQVHVISANHLKGTRLGVADPYVGISINDRAVLARTSTKQNTLKPHWGTTLFILLNQNNMSETLNLQIYDENEHRKDALMGQASFDLHGLLEDATHEAVEKPVLKEGKERGSILFDLSYFPVIVPAVVDGKPEPLPETSVGIVRFTIHQAKELDKTKSSTADLNPVAKLYLSGAKDPHFTTATYRHTLSPIWEAATEFLVPNKKKSLITVKIIDERALLADPVVGVFTAKLEDILQMTASKGADAWYPLSQCMSGKVRVSAVWKPLDMAGNMQGAGSYKPPIGVIRLWVKKANDVKNVEATLGGKSDPYLRVLLAGVVKARTDVVNNNLNPEWDQIVYIPVHSLRESLILEAMDYQNLTRDRPLGSVELKVSDLAKINPDDRKHPFASLGKKVAQSPIHLDKTITKGTLSYEAEFIPSLNVKGIEFEDKNELERAVEEDYKELDGHGEEPSGDTSNASSDADYEKVPTDVAESKILPAAPTTATVALKAETVPSVPPTPTSPSSADQGEVTMTKAEVLETPCGIIVFNAKSGRLGKKARLEILLDDSYWPAFVTERAKSTTAKWDAVGEGFVKEMEFGRVWLRLNENDDGDKESLVGEYKCETKTFLDKCWNQEAEFSLTDGFGEPSATVTLAAKFVPVKVQLEARESINNMGVLRVDLLDARDLPSADRGGKSDPYVVFNLGGEKVFKSETKKKTLAPVWNENFNTSIPSRVAAQFSLEVLDWDQLGTDTSLGEGKIDLATLEPFVATEKWIPLASSKFGQKGEVRVRMVFQPEIIAKTRKNTSTFSIAGRAMTQIGGLPIGAGRSGVSGVGKMAKGIFGKPRSVDDKSEPADEGMAGQVSVPAAGASSPSAGYVIANDTSLPPGAGSAPNAAGTIKVTVVGAKDVSTGGEASVKPYLVLRAGKEEFKTKHGSKTTNPEDETFTIPSSNDLKIMNVAIYDHKTLGKDKMLGEGDVDIWRHLQASTSESAPAVDVVVELRQGAGQVFLKLEFERTTRARSGTGTGTGTGTISSGSRMPTTGSPSRFSLTKRQDD